MPKIYANLTKIKGKQGKTEEKHKKRALSDLSIYPLVTLNSHGYSP